MPGEFYGSIGGKTGKKNSMRKEWNIVVNWKKSNEEYVAMILRDPAEAYKKAHHVIWIVGESRFVRTKVAVGKADKFATAEERIRITANEVALAKRLLAAHVQEIANEQESPVTA
jgi:hypothetical protein